MKRLRLIIQLIVGALVFAMIFFITCSSPSENVIEPISQTISVPKYNYDIRVDITPGNTNSLLECYDLTNELLKEFNYTFFHTLDTANSYGKDYKNGVEIQWRITHPVLREWLPVFEESGELKNLSKDRRTVAICRTKILTKENNWKYTVYDNGKVETHELNIYDSLNIECVARENFNHLAYEDEYKWSCNYIYNFDGEQLYGFDYRIIQKISKAINQKVIINLIEEK